MGPPTLLVAGHLAGEAGQTAPDAVPVDYIMTWLRTRMPEFGGRPPAALADRVLVVRAKTGSGKSTVLPAHTLRLIRSKEARSRLQGAGIMCTQPRIVTAQALAREMSTSPHYPDLDLRETVGYLTGPASEAPPSGLIYATAGTFLEMLRHGTDADILDRYRFIMIDEAHERSLDLDLILLYLKAFLRRCLGNPRMPFVLLMSATLQVAKFAAYFGLGAANVIEVTGSAYAIETVYPEAGAHDYNVAAADRAVAIHEANQADDPDRADILIFMPGGQEIDNVVSLLLVANAKYLDPGSPVRPFLTMAITREVIVGQGRDYMNLMAPPELQPKLPLNDGQTYVRPARRIIVTTVVAETGLTIETLKYVIDGGWNRSIASYYPSRLGGLIDLPAPRSRVIQRRGRVGRLVPGQFYPLYTREVYDALPAEQQPDIITQGLGRIFLEVAAITAAANGEVFRVGEIDMLDAPPVDSLASAMEEAHVYGYIRTVPAAGGDELTDLGRLAARFRRLTMAQIQTLLAGYMWGASMQDLAYIVALYDRTPPEGMYSREFKDENGEKHPWARDPPGSWILRAGFPPSLFLAGDTPRSCHKRAQALFADGFIAALVEFEGFHRALEATSGDLGALEAWCSAHGVNLPGARELAARRDGVIEDMLGAGLNPFWGADRRFVDTAAEDMPAAIGRLKQCIYAGLRLDILRFDPATNLYQTRGGAGVVVPEAYTDTALKKLAGAADPRTIKPQLLVTSAVRLIRQVKADLGYVLAAGPTSVLDGYVDVDEAYWTPREAADGGADSVPDGAAAPEKTAPQIQVRAYLQIVSAVNPSPPRTVDALTAAMRMEIFGPDLQRRLFPAAEADAVDDAAEASARPSIVGGGAY